MRGLAHAQLRGQPAAQGDREAPPQLRGPPVERDRGQVVVAVRADRFPEFGVVVGVGPVAGPSPAMGAHLTSASGPASAGASANPPAPAPGTMHGTEPGTGESDKPHRMRSDLLRYSFGAAGGSGVQQMPHIALVLPAARRADRGASVPAADQQRMVRLILRGEQHLPAARAVPVAFAL